MTKALLSFLAFAVLLRADFNPSRWEFRRALGALEAHRGYVVVLDRTVYEGAQQDLSDLRVTQDGQEVPYVLETQACLLEQTELRPEILDRVVVPGIGLQLTLDLRRPAKHNRLRIATAQTNFRTKVRIETSADGRTWAVARFGGYVFDFSQGDTRVSVLAVDYPLSTRCYVRATFMGWMRTDAVRDAWLTNRQEVSATWQIVAVAKPVRVEDRGTSRIVLDLGASMPHSRLRIATDTPLFQRACQIESSSNRKDWTYIARGLVYRFPDEESLALDFPEQHDRYVRLTVLNGDDRPVAIQRVSFETLERRVRFLAQSPGEYALHYGNRDASRPSYDLAAILARRASASEVLLAAGPQQTNPVYQPSVARKPWSERHPSVLYVVLAGAILGMGYITVRFFLGVRKTAVTQKS